jgi:hypothetical protein
MLALLAGLVGFEFKHVFTDKNILSRRVAVQSNFQAEELVLH